jgi:hypothetical protein
VQHQLSKSAEPPRGGEAQNALLSEGEEARVSSPGTRRPFPGPDEVVSYTVAQRSSRSSMPPKRRARSALELHARYFDPDHDEAVTPKQTLNGMTALGLPWLVAAPLALVINGFLGYLTRRKASLSISVPDIARGKHGFESGVFDQRGELDEAAFAELFMAPHARPPRDCLTYRELRALMIANGDPGRPFGWIGSVLSRLFSAAEVFTLFCLASDRQKLIGDQVLPAMSRKNLRRFYEGRLFPLLARRRRIALSRAP